MPSDVESQNLQTILSNYELLEKRIDADFVNMRAKFSTRINCKRGCSSCCKPNLDIGTMEAAYLKLKIENNPALKLKLEHLKIENPHQSQRCEFLEADGACGVYEIRPLMCRAFGGPSQYQTASGEIKMGICELNQEGFDLLHMKSEDVLDMNWITRLIGALNLAYSPEGKRLKERFALSLNAILHMQPKEAPQTSSMPT
jgi:Fe-S-cluster containining protein